MGILDRGVDVDRVFLSGLAMHSDTDLKDFINAFSANPTPKGSPLRAVAGPYANTVFLLC